MFCYAVQHVLQHLSTDAAVSELVFRSLIQESIYILPFGSSTSD